MEGSFQLSKLSSTLRWHHTAQCARDTQSSPWDRSICRLPALLIIRSHGPGIMRQDKICHHQILDYQTGNGILWGSHWISDVVTANCKHMFNYPRGLRKLPNHLRNKHILHSLPEKNYKLFWLPPRALAIKSSGQPSIFSQGIFFLIGAWRPRRIDLLGKDDRYPSGFPFLLL